MFDQVTTEIINIWTSSRRTKRSPTGWISGNAPCCTHRGETPDTRGRGGMLPSGGGVSYHCFNCGFTASYQPGWHLNYKIRKLLSWLGTDENSIKRLVIDAIRVKEIVGVPEIKEQENKPIEFKERSLPEGAMSFRELATWHALNDWQDIKELAKAVDYISNRRIHIDITNPDSYDFYITDSTENAMNRRVIIPFYWGEKIVGYTGRSLFEKITPKYWNQMDPGYVFNVNRQKKENKIVIVTEGPFDAMSIDGVAVLHEEITEQQADIIDSLGKEVIVVPDFDLKDYKGRKIWTGSKLADAAIEYGWSVSFPVWNETCKDVNDAVCKYGTLFTLKSIIDGTVSSRLKIELKKKLYNR